MGKNNCLPVLQEYKSKIILRFRRAIFHERADVIKEVFAFFKKPAPSFPPKAKTQMVLKGSYADITKIKKDIGWKPRFSIKDGVKKTLEELTGQNIFRS